MTERMTDAEVICSRMEKKPSGGPVESGRFTWWGPHDEIAGKWAPIPLTLDLLREVQETLTDEQWQRYLPLLAGHWETYYQFSDLKTFIHADIQQKKKALAAVLREEKNG